LDFDARSSVRNPAGGSGGAVGGTFPNGKALEYFYEIELKTRITYKMTFIFYFTGGGRTAAFWDVEEGKGGGGGAGGLEKSFDFSVEFFGKGNGLFVIKLSLFPL